ncbi:hypothetical protein ACQP2F_18975 [Actinoplanes sp. CA-030573]|uniref:hypothetical protein n=1 Tax=Actinoplanes sp. CA-030573 TaxID=3239898 RepID=UPI003D8D1023
MADSITLTLLIGKVIPTPAPPELIDALQSVQVTTAVGRTSGFQLTFAAGRRSLINRVLLPAGYFDPPTRVVLVAVVKGTPHVLSDGIITQHQVAPSTTPGSGTLTVTGEDLTALMNLATQWACFPAMGPAARVARICAKYAVYGIAPIVIPPLQEEVRSPEDKIFLQSATDLAYVQGLAAEAGYVFYLDPGPVPLTSRAYWGPEVRIGLPQPPLNVDMGPDTNVESLSFGFDGQSATQFSIQITEPNTKITVSVPVPDISVLRPPLAARPAPALRQQPLPDTSKLSAVQAALLGAGQTAQLSDAVTGQGTLDVLRYGQVLKARGLVWVRGAGLAYDGLYYVTSVTSDLKRGQYKQSFSLGRGGLVSVPPATIPRSLLQEAR